MHHSENQPLTKEAKRRQRLQLQALKQENATCYLPQFGQECSNLCKAQNCPAGGGIDTCVSKNRQQ